MYEDKGASGVRASRPEWDKCLERLEPGDALVSVRLDRIGRSVQNLIEVANLLRERGVDLVCLDQPIDTTTPLGKMFFTILAAFAEFEHDLIVERTRDGLASTTARGREGGRKHRLTPEQQAQAARLRADGHSIREIGVLLGNGKPVCRQTVYRALGDDRARPEAGEAGDPGGLGRLRFRLAPQFPPRWRELRLRLGVGDADGGIGARRAQRKVLQPVPRGIPLAAQRPVADHPGARPARPEDANRPRGHDGPLGRVGTRARVVQFRDRQAEEPRRARRSLASLIDPRQKIIRNPQLHQGRTRHTAPNCHYRLSLQRPRRARLSLHHPAAPAACNDDPGPQ